MDKKRFAFVGSCEYAATSDSGVVAVSASETREIVKLALGEAATLNVDTTLSTVGDEIVVKVTSDGTARDLTFGTGITGPVLTGTANKTKVQSFIFDGEGFIAAAPAVQID